MSRSLLRLCIACVVISLAGPAFGDRARDREYEILVFALVGPLCPVPIPELCPDGLLAGVELVLERSGHRNRRFEMVAISETNEHGYASFVVRKRGFYRINVLRNGSGFEGPVTFWVPARVTWPRGRLTAVPVHFLTPIL